MNSVLKERFSEKQTPNCFLKKDNGEIETIGKTDMSDGELKALLEQRKVVQARIYHRNEHWHCFYFMFKGLAGLESGMMGAKPHYHYISDKSGISREELNKRISECDMPSSKKYGSPTRFRYRKRRKTAEKLKWFQ
jgi:Zn-finger nucleic acid-binding protein